MKAYEIATGYYWLNPVTGEKEREIIRREFDDETYGIEDLFKGDKKRYFGKFLRNCAKN